jgi:hypothetical protein
MKQQTFKNSLRKLAQALKSSKRKVRLLCSSSTGFARQPGSAGDDVAGLFLFLFYSGLKAAV